MRVVIALVMLMVVSTGCATSRPDRRMEAYNAYSATVDEAVAKGEITKLDGETLKYNAMQDIQRAESAEQAQRAASMGALYGGLGQMQMGQAATAAANRPYVSGSRNRDY